MQLNALKDLLRQAGVVGAGGAGFPSYAKLADGVDTILLNCAECEPLLKVHRQVLEAFTFEILSALSMLVESVGAKKGIVAIKSHYRSTLEALRAEIGDFPKLSIKTLKSVYPAGDEIILIKEVTGRTVMPGKLPSSVGVTVCNVESVQNVYRALQGKPVTKKFVTVAGEVKSPSTMCVPLGTKISELIEAVGGLTVSDPAYIIGGPMMGKIVSPMNAITKTTNAIIVLPRDHAVVLNKTRNASINLRRAMSTCCQCHSCTELCSRHVIGYPVEPHMVMRVLANGGKGNLFRIEGSMFCSGCGLCETYSCPQGLSPRALIAELKNTARENGYQAPDITELEEIKDPDLKKISVERLTMRLGLRKYDVPAPLSQDFETNSVKIPLSQHLGVPAMPCVKEGDQVKCGDIIGLAQENKLGVNIHASIDGTIVSVSDKYVKIKK